MMDIDIYSHQEDYENFQNCRPDYYYAILKAIELAKNYVPNGKDLVVGDFCCGTGSNMLKYSNSVGGIKRAILIDINKGFLDIAKRLGIKAKDLVIKNEDILDVNFTKECGLVFSIFAYHHIRNKYKEKYIKQIVSCMQENGILILAEIYFENKEECVKYYDELFKNIPEKKRVAGLKKFLDQTARSEDFEFKVSKDFADNQFQKSFEKLEEIKIYPKNGSKEYSKGTFVQVYRLK